MKFLKVIVSILMLCFMFFSANYLSTNSQIRNISFDKASSMLEGVFDLKQSVSAQGMVSNSAQLIARAINGEARGEPYVGQVAVGAVILNRVKNPAFPKTIAGVIYQPGAFTAVSDGQINVPIDVSSTVFKAAQDALNGWDPTGGAIYYYNPAKTTNSWIWSRQVLTTIGKHIFAR